MNSASPRNARCLFADENRFHSDGLDRCPTRRSHLPRSSFQACPFDYPGLLVLTAPRNCPLGCWQAKQTEHRSKLSSTSFWVSKCIGPGEGYKIEDRNF